MREFFGWWSDNPGLAIYVMFVVALIIGLSII